MNRNDSDLRACVAARTDHPLFHAMVMTILLLVPTMARAEAGAFFEDKKGVKQLVDRACLSGDKWDKRWATVKYPDYDGRKVKILIKNNETEMGGGSEMWVGGAGDLLAKALLETGRFAVVENGPSEYRVSASLQGAGMEFGSTGTGIAQGIGSAIGLGGGGLSQAKSRMQMTIRVTRSKTGEVVFLETVTGTSKGGGFELGGGILGSKLPAALSGVGVSKSKMPSTALAALVCVQKAAWVLTERLASER